MLMRRGPFAGFSRADLIDEVLALRAEAKAGRPLHLDLEAAAAKQRIAEQLAALVEEVPLVAAEQPGGLSDEGEWWPETIAGSRHERAVAHLDNDRLRARLGDALERNRLLVAELEAARGVGGRP